MEYMSLVADLFGIVGGLTGLYLGIKSRMARQIHDRGRQKDSETPEHKGSDDPPDSG